MIVIVLIYRSPLIILCQKKYTQISSEGATVYRQVMKHIVRNPCKNKFTKN